MPFIVLVRLNFDFKNELEWVCLLNLWVVLGGMIEWGLA